MAGIVLLRGITVGALLLGLGACSTGGFAIGDRVLTFPWDGPQETATNTPNLPAMVPGETFGHGPVRVALLLPLSDPALSGMAVAMANGARLAIGFIEANPNIAENITIALRDSGASAGSASQAATAALQE